jgi:hypothetical protein
MGRSFSNLENEYIREKNIRMNPIIIRYGRYLLVIFETKCITANERVNEIVSSVTKNVLDS